ncbi:ATP-binding protein [Streptomyces sp. NPDC006684]|uniref:ATP-binding protein n=1 Tax=Streptomyces sp. NPDC006684 TaxID=3154477 RepID=UPI003452674F
MHQRPPLPDQAAGAEPPARARPFVPLPHPNGGQLTAWERSDVNEYDDLAPCSGHAPGGFAPGAFASGVGVPAYNEVLPRTGESAAPARRLVRLALAVWGLDALADAATLVVSELVANAVTHARGETIRVVVARLDGRSAEIAVSDSSRARPVLRPAEPEALGGRGLLLVETYATKWGTESKPWGKRVWAEVRG